MGDQTLNRIRWFMFIPVKPGNERFAVIRGIPLERDPERRHQRFLVVAPRFLQTEPGRADVGKERIRLLLTPPETTVLFEQALEPRPERFDVLTRCGFSESREPIQASAASRQFVQGGLG